MGRNLRFLFLEPFYGGSHKDFADGLAAASRHSIDLISLPARFWKWRMRGAALYFVNRIEGLDTYDGLITSDILSLADFKALSPLPCPPVLLYFHENQLTYPLAPTESADYQFGFTNITTALAADRILFNSRFHLHAFFDALPDFIGMMPEFHPRWVIEVIREKSDYLYPGCQFSSESISQARDDKEPPLIIWNHRWEFDKNPADFFYVLDKVAARGIDFRLALLGENYQAVPKAFIQGQIRLGDRVVHSGYLPDKSDYCDWLNRGDVVVSTAIQENFGIAIIEAIRHGCLPLLPDRLSYPEILPSDFHHDFLYRDREELAEKLSRVLLARDRYEDQRASLVDAMTVFSWDRRIHLFDAALEALAV